MKRTNVYIEVEYYDTPSGHHHLGGELAEWINDVNLKFKEETKRIKLRCICFEEKLSLSEVLKRISDLGCRPAMFFERYAAEREYCDFPIPDSLYFLGSYIYEIINNGRPNAKWIKVFMWYLRRKKRLDKYHPFRGRQKPYPRDECKKCFSTNAWFAMVAK